jgi:hypothetical protein
MAIPYLRMATNVAPGVAPNPKIKSGGQRISLNLLMKLAPRAGFEPATNRLTAISYQYLRRMWVFWWVSVAGAQFDEFRLTY